MPQSFVKQAFDISGRVAIITGGGGFFGRKHAEAIAEMGGYPVIFDLDKDASIEVASDISGMHNVSSLGLEVDVTQAGSVEKGLTETLKSFGQVDILINNAANDPKVAEGQTSSRQWSRLENFPPHIWEQDLAVGLTGAYLCSKIIGSHMASHGGGVILNIASDLGIIAPDQRIYRRADISDEDQQVKPISYSVVKSGLVGLTRYLATYWSDKGVRANVISPGGIYAGQDPEFVEKLSNLIPLGRMANPDEYKAAIVFLVSDASTYMTGANLVIDGGRTTW